MTKAQNKGSNIRHAEMCVAQKRRKTAQRFLLGTICLRTFAFYQDINSPYHVSGMPNRSEITCSLYNIATNNYTATIILGSLTH